ncbi:MAG: hypothetical protein BGO21_21225 [Dyadobacter sp. 50-39]|uniref:hypothetical protein n=1 Tax=Dyadobacter sp. 50-39 TaxID=1895756 RepID=UPI00095E9B05|nr:hypothetical protein [Dyadobacter sp. 50-39]OJV19218.1 MAG: hypothetical protein BGO21_21225 [Dyadobacter sp. 50-39]
MRILYRIILAFVLHLSFYGFAAAQLTVFNVPSSEITDRGRISFQQQFEIGDQVESSTTATYGLGKNWEIGLNLLNLDYGLSSHRFEFNDLADSIPYAPLLMANAQKVFDLTNHLSIGLGAIAGTNLSGHNHPGFSYYTYSNLLFEAGAADQYKFAAGAYAGNHHFLGKGPVAGFQGGLDAGIWYEKLHFLADWISGNHPKGRLSLGVSIYITKQLPLSLGWQRSNEDGSQAGVIQLTVLPK